MVRHAGVPLPDEHGCSEEEHGSPEGQGAGDKRHRREAQGGQDEAGAAESTGEEVCLLNPPQSGLWDLLPAQGLQVHQPAGPVQVVLRPSFHSSSLRLLDHEEQQQHGDQAQTRSHLRHRKQVSRRGPAGRGNMSGMLTRADAPAEPSASPEPRY